MKFLPILILLFSISSLAQCPDSVFEKNIKHFQYDTKFSIFYDGYALSCETICQYKNNCQEKCQKKMAKTAFLKSLNPDEKIYFEFCTSSYSKKNLQSN